MKQFNYCVAFLQSQKRAPQKIFAVPIQSIFKSKSNLEIISNPIPNITESTANTTNLVAKQNVEGGVYFAEQDKFVFKNGVEVHWKFEAEDEKIETSNEKFKYVIGNNFQIQKDLIQIDQKFNTKLAVSIAISRSILLEDMETAFEKYLLETKGIPQLIMEGNFNKLTRENIQKLIGRFMQLRFKLNLSNNPYIELSEFTWNDPASEVVMKEAFSYFDIYARVGAMNRKLDYASEITNLLKSSLTERHGFRLEWIIIILIALEFALSLSQEWRYHFPQKEQQQLD